MRVLILTQNFPPVDGGIAIFVQHVCQELRRNSIHVEVLAQDMEGAEEFNAAQPYVIHRYQGRGRMSSIAPIVRTIFYTLRSRADVV